MKPHTLIFLRHAKAEPPNPGQTDADRPLAGRGVADARAAGAWLAAQGLHPNLVLCSPARRTRQTWAAANEASASAAASAVAASAVAGVEPVRSADPPVAYVPALYANGVDALIELVAGVPDEITTLLVIGHNPTLSVASAVLDPGGGHGSGLRTAGIAVHIVAGAWTGCGRGGAPLTMAHTARMSSSTP
jgi:phosphohistidine phosphatase